MKRLMIVALAIGLSAGAASAQTTGSNSSRTTRMSSTGSYKAKQSKKQKTLPSEALNNRKIYHWQSGQRATPTGEEAAPTNGGYQAIKRGAVANRQKEQD